jgi:putative flippase GtrA
MASTELTRQAQRFAISGLLVTGLHVLVATCFINFVLDISSLANGVAFVVATAFSYMINTLWSFSSPLHRRNLLRFVLVSLVGCFFAVAVSGTAQYYDLHYMYGIGLVVCTVPPVTFLLHSFWTYR